VPDCQSLYTGKSLSTVCRLVYVGTADWWIDTTVYYKMKFDDCRNLYLVHLMRAQGDI